MVKLSETLQQVKTFNAKTYDCPKCHGRKNVSNPDGSVSPCVCLIREQFLNYLGFLQHLKSLESSPLSEHLLEPKSIMVEYPEVDILHAHLKTALIAKRSMKYQWATMTPDQILGALFETDKKQSIYTPDLLIILSSTFPHYAAAGNHINYVVRTRELLGKITWFCCPDIDKIIVRNSGSSQGIVDELHAFLVALPRVKLSRQFKIKETGGATVELSDFSSKLGIRGIHVEKGPFELDNLFQSMLNDLAIKVPNE